MMCVRLITIEVNYDMKQRWRMSCLILHGQRHPINASIFFIRVVEKLADPQESCDQRGAKLQSEAAHRTIEA